MSSLGLLMQLAGSVFPAGCALVTFVSLYAAGRTPRSLAAWLFLLLGISIARSLVHRMAGSELLYGAPATLDGRPRSPLGGIRRYLHVAVAHTVVFCLVVRFALHVPTTPTLAIAAGLALWPSVLGVLLHTDVLRRFERGVPLAEDKGFEAAAILMTVLGACGVLATTMMLVLLFESAGREVLRDGRTILVAMGLTLLVARSCIHVQAGVCGLRETSVDHAVELANRYANFGVIASFCVGGALLLAFITQTPNVFGLVLITSVCWMLMAWPLIVRRFFGDRQFAELLAGDQAALHRRAPDAGLTGLGWLLLGHAVLGASFAIPQLCGVLARHDLPGGVTDVLAILTAHGDHSPWWQVGVIVLQAWAGYELVRMTSLHRVIATLYAGVASVIAVVMDWPMVHELKHANGMAQIAGLLPIAIALVLPIATLVLVHRKIAPTARARFRPRGT
ncbi:MAG TPA: hypothetical protein VFQ53_10920 [Kofleriaceae bacterium]|nr:hypothetical protein [Kofleriaceae bacterium]